MVSAATDFQVFFLRPPQLGDVRCDRLQVLGLLAVAKLECVHELNVPGGQRLRDGFHKPN